MKINLLYATVAIALWLMAPTLYSNDIGEKYNRCLAEIAAVEDEIHELDKVIAFYNAIDPEEGNMDVSIIGGGLTAAAINAFSIKQRLGHNIDVHEKEDCVGGLCKTIKVCGMDVDACGPHIFRSSNDIVISLMKNHAKINYKNHYVGSRVDDCVYTWPLSQDVMTYIGGERGLQKKYGHSNFEEAAISVFGHKAYGMFVKPYTENMWHKKAKELDTTFASRVLYINQSDKRYFKDAYQGWPDGGWSSVINSMLKGAKIHLNSEVSHIVINNPDYIAIDTSPLDEQFDCIYGNLEYVGLEFQHKVIDGIPDDYELLRYSTINYPNCDRGYIRATNYNNVTGTWLPNKNVIGYEYPCLQNKTHPFPSETEKEKRMKYLILASKRDSIIPAGKLGTFQYLSMDEAIQLARRTAYVIKHWKGMSEGKRLRWMIDGLKR